MIKHNSLIRVVLTLALALASVSHAKLIQQKKKLQQAKEQIAYPKSYLTTKYTSWGINPNYKKSSINLLRSWKLFKKKRAVTVAVVDTGIQFDHPFLKNNVYTTKGRASAKNYGVDFSKSAKLVPSMPKDTNGHGTHVSGIIKSIFPEVKILALKYYNPTASGTDNLKATIKALKYAVDNNVDIINYSGGGPKPSKAEREILLEAERKGILVIAAAGNEKSNIDYKTKHYYPASYGFSNIITVGAHDEFNQIIASSNYGTKSVEIAAPGYRIKSAFIRNSTSIMTGTSQATAFVTGVTALIKSNFPKLNYQQVKNIILTSSLKVPALKSKILGGGKLDAARALEVAKYVNDRLYPPSGRSVARRK